MKFQHGIHHWDEQIGYKTAQMITKRTKHTAPPKIRRITRKICQGKLCDGNELDRAICRKHIHECVSEKNRGKLEEEICKTVAQNGSTCNWLWVASSVCHYAGDIKTREVQKILIVKFFKNAVVQQLWKLTIRGISSSRFSWENVTFVWSASQHEIFQKQKFK